MRIGLRDFLNLVGFTLALSLMAAGINGCSESARLSADLEHVLSPGVKSTTMQRIEHQSRFGGGSSE